MGASGRIEVSGVVGNSFPGVGGVDSTPNILGHALV